MTNLSTTAGVCWFIAVLFQNLVSFPALAPVCYEDFFGAKRKGTIKLPLRRTRVL
jgi:hypothetical protein